MATDVAQGKSNGKLSEKEKAKLRKQKQKENRQLRRQQEEQRKAEKPEKEKPGIAEDIEIEYVSAPLELDGPPSDQAPPEEDPEEERMGLGLGMGGIGLGGLGFTKPKPENPYEDFKKVFERFATAEQATGAVPLGEDTDEERDEEGDQALAKPSKAAESSSDSDSDDDDEKPRKKGMSKKQQKLLTRLKIAELKQLCDRPEVVEVWDVTSPDPQTLVFLKAYRNTVHVPRHWSQKRKYLQGKRGIEKPPFKLPDFIENTGIGEMRQAYQEKEQEKKLKQKQRDRMAPKMGRMDIDYQILHDAFFKHQTRPKLTAIGEVYYEGKEFEASVGNVRPGVLSEELRTALGMAENNPPPWLINMQRYGPPPSYSNLKIPGLNAPIPPGASFGYQAGGWGKPPVDEDGNPLYGDVFGQDDDGQNSDEEVDKGSRWGELDPDLEESSEEEEEEEEEDGDGDIADGIASGMVSGLASGMVSGLTSGMVSGLATGISSALPSGIDTPSMIVNLRKESESEQPKQLYTVLEQKQVSVGASSLMGSEYVYTIPGGSAGGGGVSDAGQPGKKEKKKLGVMGGVTDVEVTLSPEEVEGLDEAALKALYDEKVRAANKKESFADMVAGHAAQQKRKAASKAEDKAAKKAKDFKF